tara:strand:- start:1799 stop:2224 length:426 start_codon:yes stop_codon:yes gene_type:complete
MWLRSSSGSLANDPHLDLMFSEAVYALPAGFTPRGCEGSATATSSSSFWKLAAAESLTFLEGRDSAQAKLGFSNSPGAMSDASGTCNVIAQHYTAQLQTRALDTQWMRRGVIGRSNVPAEEKAKHGFEFAPKPWWFFGLAW